MQKPRNSEGLYIQQVYAVKAALALLGLMLSCSVLAQENSIQLAVPKDSSPNKAEAQQVAESSATAGNDLTTLTQVTMEQSIEAARKRKLRELAESVRKQLEEKLPNTQPVAGISNMSLPVGNLPEVVMPALAPRLWSLMGNGPRVWAEVLFNGKLIQLDSINGQLVQLDSDEGVAALGPWAVLTLTSDGLVLGRKVKVAAKKGKAVMQQERMLLRPPVRGISAITYRFAAPGTVTTDVLTESAQRAAQLPLDQSGMQK